MVKANNNTKVSNITKNKTTSKKKTTKKNSKLENIKLLSSKKRNFVSLVIIFLLGTLMLVSTYAWLSTNLHVKVKNFNMIVSQNSGLSISLDGINFGTYVEISEEILMNELRNTYPNNTSQWSSNGLVPVSSYGTDGPNDSTFNFFSSVGVKYRDKDKKIGYLTTTLMADDTSRKSFNRYIAFDLFLKNATGSPTSDNLYLEPSSYLILDSDSEPTTPEAIEDLEEIKGLVNSARFGIVRIGSVDLDASVNEIQNMQCNNACSYVIYEPNSTNHTKLSIERAMKYGLNLTDGEYFPTYAYTKSLKGVKVEDTISGSANLDLNNFRLQETLVDEDLANPIFEIPSGITKIRIYVWLEGQDIDSLETDSEGAKISISLDFSKDTYGYNSYDE